MSIYAAVRFTQDFIGKTGLSPTLTVIRVSDNAVVINAQAMSEIGDGFYKRDITSAISTAVEYVGFADGGSDDLDSRYQELDFSNLQIGDYVDDIEGDVLTALASYGVGTEAKQDLILETLEVSEGARLLEIAVVKTGTSTPIPDVFVALYPALSDILISTGRSDINGELSFSLDDGSYRLVCYKVGYSFTNPTSITIAGNDSIEIEGDAVVIESPIPISSCRVYEYLYDLSGVTPISEERVTGNATAYIVPFDFNEDRLIEAETVEGTYDESTGLIYWDIAKGATVSFRIPIVGISKTVLIPDDESSARLYDLTLEEEET